MTLATRPSTPRIAEPLYSAADLRIMRAVAAGATHDAIARDMGISRRSVQQRLSRLYSRLGAVNAPHAVALLIGAGAIPAPRPMIGVG
jgi:DNA-binding CsgD family transcriptional regulator